jgi:hypothetical protein
MLIYVKAVAKRNDAKKQAGQRLLRKTREETGLVQKNEGFHRIQDVGGDVQRQSLWEFFFKSVDSGRYSHENRNSHLERVWEAAG